MKLLLISRCPPYPLHLGDRLIPYHLARTLSARGHQIDLLAYYQELTDPAQTAAYAGLFRSVELIREPRRTSLSYLARLTLPGWLFPKNAIDAWSPDMWNAIRKAMLKHQYDVVQLFGGIHVYEFRKLVMGKPTVIVPYESYALYLRRAMVRAQSWKGRLGLHAQEFIARQFERRMYTGFKRVVMLSRVDADVIHRINPWLPVQVIPNGIDLGYFQPLPDSKEEAPTLIFFGNLAYAPNVDAALYLIDDIFPLIRARLPDARLLLVGNEPPAVLQQRAGGSIDITGRVPDLRPYVQRAHVVISPLRMGAGIKNKVLEAMAMGRPVVATPLSCDGIDLQAGKHAVVGNSTQVLSDACIDLLTSPGRRRALADAGRQLVESRYSWERVADAYEAMYDQLMENPT